MAALNSHVPAEPGRSPIRPAIAIVEDVTAGRRPALNFHFLMRSKREISSQAISDSAIPGGERESMENRRRPNQTRTEGALSLEASP